MAPALLLGVYIVATAVICGATGFHPVPVLAFLVFISICGKAGRV